MKYCYGVAGKNKDATNVWIETFRHLDLMTRSDPKQPVDLIGLITEQILFAGMNTGEQMAGLHLCPSGSTHTQTKLAQMYVWLSIFASILPQAHRCLPVSLSTLLWLTLQRENKGQTWWDEKRGSGLTWKAIKPLDKEGFWKGHWMVHWSNMILDHQWKQSHYILCCSQAKQQIMDGFIVQMEIMLLSLLLIILFFTN